MTNFIILVLVNIITTFKDFLYLIIIIIIKEFAVIN